MTTPDNTTPPEGTPVGRDVACYGCGKTEPCDCSRKQAERNQGMQMGTVHPKPYEFVKKEEIDWENMEAPEKEQMRKLLAERDAFRRLAIRSATVFPSDCQEYVDEQARKLLSEPKANSRKEGAGA